MNKALASLLSSSVLSSHALQLPETAASDNWLMLIPAGTFSGRDGRGPYHAGDRAKLEQIAEATRRYAGATDLVVDYEHQSLHAANNGQPAPASGWIKAVEARDDGLYGRIEWTPKAAAAIEAKEYRYLSPVYFHTASGDILALQNVALTNSPNLQMAGVSAHSVFSPPQEVNMDKILAALGLAAGASETDVLTAINSLMTGHAAIAAAAGLKADAKATEIVTAMQSAVSTAAPDPTKYVPIAMVTAMQADLAALKEGRKAEDAEEAVAKAIKDGKVVPALKDWAIAMHKADPAQFAAFVAAAPVLTAAQTATAAPPKVEGGTPGALTAQQRAMASAMGIDPAAYAKTLAAEASEREEDL